MDINLHGLTKEELLEKLATAVCAIKVEEEVKYSLKVRWDKDGMYLTIGLE